MNTCMLIVARGAMANHAWRSMCFRNSFTHSFPPSRDVMGFLMSYGTVWTLARL